MQVFATKEVFLPNTSDKQNFLEIMSTASRNEKHSVINCPEDTDLKKKLIQW